MSDCECAVEGSGAGERRLLRVLLGINAIMFGVELAAGIAADSAGLLADSLDMLADATVYGIVLAAVGAPPPPKPGPPFSAVTSRSASPSGSRPRCSGDSSGGATLNPRG